MTIIGKSITIDFYPLLLYVLLKLICTIKAAISFKTLQDCSSNLIFYIYKNIQYLVHRNDAAIFVDI